MTPTPAQPGSSFGKVNGEFTASDPQLENKGQKTSMLTSTGIQNSKTRPPQIELYRTGVSNLSKNCTCGISTGTPSNCGTSTVVCTVTTRNRSFHHQLVQELHLWELVDLLNSTGQVAVNHAICSQRLRKGVPTGNGEAELCAEE